MLDAVRDRRYRLLWLAGLASNIVRWMDLVVVGWLALSLTNSPFMVGVAGFARAMPMMALGPFAGVLADRLPRGRVMITVQAVNVVAASALALVFAAGLGGFRPLVLIELVLGAAWAVDFPARRTTFSTLVAPERLAQALSLEAVSMQAAKIVGPLLGGVLLARAGPGACYLVLAILSAAALTLVSQLARVMPLPGRSAAGPVLASLAEGLAEVRARPAILRVLALTVIINVLVFPYQQMMPVFARDVLRVGPELLGLLVAAEGVGAIAGALALAARRGTLAHARVFAAACVLTALVLLGFAGSRWYGLSLALQAAIGVTEAGFGTMQSTIVLLAAPEAARGRAMGILSACIGTQPFGTLWVGFLAGAIGAPAATALDAALALCLMAPVAARMLRLAP